MVFVTLSSSWNIITACVSHPARDRRCLSESTSTWLPRSFSHKPLSSASWNQKFLLDMTEKTLKAVVNGCAWGLRDSQGSLLNQSWQILTTSSEVQRVLNYRPCDQRHKHGRLPDHFSAFSLQFPQSLCQTLAKQFLVKDSWNSALDILEQLHADDDGRPFNPSASSWEKPVVWTLTASERKEITNWLQKK